jgi:hypothetical protein
MRTARLQVSIAELLEVQSAGRRRRFLRRIGSHVVGKSERHAGCGDNAGRVVSI